MRRLERVVVTWLATARGGAERSTAELCRAIASRYPVEVELLLWDHGAGLGLADDDAAQSVICRSGEEYRRRLAAALASRPDTTVLFSNHRTHRVDLPLARRLGVKSAVIFREAPLADAAMRTLPTAAASELVFTPGGELGWDDLQAADALVAASDFAARHLAAFAIPHPRVVRIYNGLVDPQPEVETRPRPVRRFLMVSRLIGWKAIDFGIAAFAGLRQAHPDARLQIAGEGEEAAALRRLVDRLELGGGVELLGFRPDIDLVYEANDFLLHVSPIESFGRVVVEANARGLPTIVAQSAGTGELVVNGHTGLTFRAGDEADCRRALMDAYQLGAADYRRLSETARRRAHALFNPARAAEEYVGLASSILLSEEATS